MPNFQLPIGKGRATKKKNFFCGFLKEAGSWGIQLLSVNSVLLWVELRYLYEIIVYAVIIYRVIFARNATQK